MDTYIAGGIVDSLVDIAAITGSYRRRVDPPEDDGDFTPPETPAAEILAEIAAQQRADADAEQLRVYRSRAYSYRNGAYWTAP